MKMEPCPFCGMRPPEDWRKSRFFDTHCGPALVCIKCQAHGPAAFAGKKMALMEGAKKEVDYEASMKAWNRRFTE